MRGSQSIFQSIDKCYIPEYTSYLPEGWKSSIILFKHFIGHCTVLEQLEKICQFNPDCTLEYNCRNLNKFLFSLNFPVKTRKKVGDEKRKTETSRNFKLYHIFSSLWRGSFKEVQKSQEISSPTFFLVFTGKIREKRNFLRFLQISPLVQCLP